MNEIQKIPFLRILIPVALGILAKYYIAFSVMFSTTLAISGLFVMLISFFITPKKAYSYRWLFGVGLYFVLFFVGSITTTLKQWNNIFPFSEANYVYEGVAKEVPQTKGNSIRLDLELVNYDRKVVAYIKSADTLKIVPGQQIIFFSKIEPFPKLGTVHNFNYNTYMYNQGYAGVTFIQDERWEFTKNQKYSPILFANNCRQKILNFYEDLPLNKNELAILSGLTLGYKSEFTEELIQSFVTQVQHTYLLLAVCMWA